MSSAILSADDLNDFISPGVACIKPVETLPKIEDSNPYEVTTEDKLQTENPAPASISLTDCLACSGCVTSAEAVLVSLQSHNEVLNTLDNYESLNTSTLPQAPSGASQTNAKLFVASVSPQVRASLAATFGISQRRAGRLIDQLLCGSQGLKSGGQFHSGFSYVFDTNRLREACLVLGNDELEESLNKKSQPRPVITSACPGWICYAEKTHPHVLPHLSTLKSPQALAGTLLKSLLSKEFNVHPSQIWHLALMPCFDKKLEASRQELTDKWWRDSNPDDPTDDPIRDVDCVITSRELVSLASARNIDLAELVSITSRPISRKERVSFPDPFIANFLLNRPAGDQVQKPEAATSGGYLHHILLSQQSRHPGSKIDTVRGRNHDVLDFTLISADGQPILKTARYYGFRNIQNLVRKLKPARQSKMPGAATRKMPGTSRGDGTDYSYVEVMACPGGCTNGGGQINIDDVVNMIPETRGEMVQSTQHPQSQREWLARVDEAYFSADSEGSESECDDLGSLMDTDDQQDSKTSNGIDLVQQNVVNGINVTEVRHFLDHWSQTVGVPLSKLCYTTYRVVESDVGKTKKEVSKMGDTARIAAVTSASGGGW